MIEFFKDFSASISALNALAYDSRFIIYTDEKYETIIINTNRDGLSIGQRLMVGSNNLTIKYVSNCFVVQTRWSSGKPLKKLQKIDFMQKTTRVNTFSRTTTHIVKDSKANRLRITKLVNLYFEENYSKYEKYIIR